MESSSLLIILLMSMAITVNSLLTDMKDIPWKQCKSAPIVATNHYCFGGLRKVTAYAGGDCFVQGTCDRFLYVEVTPSSDVHWYIYQKDIPGQLTYFWLSPKFREDAKLTKGAKINFLKDLQLVVNLETNVLLPNEKFEEKYFFIRIYENNEQVETIEDTDENSKIGFKFSRTELFTASNSPWRAVEFTSKTTISHKNSSGLTDYSIDVLKDRLFPNMVTFSRTFNVYLGNYQPVSAELLLSLPKNSTTTPSGSVNSTTEPSTISSNETTSSDRIKNTHMTDDDSSKKQTMYVVIGVATAGAILVIGIVSWYCCCRKDKQVAKVKRLRPAMFKSNI